jgi:hypothetical protein
MYLHNYRVRHGNVDTKVSVGHGATCWRPPKLMCAQKYVMPNELKFTWFWYVIQLNQTRVHKGGLKQYSFHFPELNHFVVFKVHWKHLVRNTNTIFQTLFYYHLIINYHHGMFHISVKADLHNYIAKFHLLDDSCLFIPPLIYEVIELLLT